MSLNFSRRNFMKLSAAAALAVAGSTLLTGCDDPNKPSRNGDGEVNLISVNTTVTRDKTVANSAKFSVKIKVWRDNDISVYPSNFCIDIKQGDKTTSYDGASGKLTLDHNAFAMKKNSEDTFVVQLSNTVTPAVTLNKGDVVTLRYRPDDTYKEMYASWVYTIE